MTRARILADYVSSGDELADKAPLASPTFTGTVAIPNVANLETAVVANTAKVTNATHSGDVTGGTALTIATDAVDIAMLSATGTAGSSTFLRGDNSWQIAGSTSASDLDSGTLAVARMASGTVIKVQLDSYNTEASTTSISTYITAVISGSYTIVNASSTLHVSGFFHVSNVGNSCFVKVEYSTDDFSSDTDLFSSGSFVLRNNNSSVINQLASFSDKHTHGLSVSSTIKYRAVVNFGGGSGTVYTNEGGGYSRIQIMEVI